MYSQLVHTNVLSKLGGHTPTEEKTVRLHPLDSANFLNGVLLARYLRKLVKAVGGPVTCDLEELKKVRKSQEANWTILFGELERMGLDTSQELKGRAETGDSEAIATLFALVNVKISSALPETDTLFDLAAAQHDLSDEEQYLASIRRFKEDGSEERQMPELLSTKGSEKPRRVVKEGVVI
jgi:hypothetical protein